MPVSRIPLLAVLALLSACGAETPPEPSAVPAQTGQTPGEAANELDALLESYTESVFELNPVWASYFGDSRYNDRFENDISPEWRARWMALQRESLAAARAIDSARLSGEALVSWEIFVRDRNGQIEALEFPVHLLPVDQINTWLQIAPALGAGQLFVPFQNVTDYQNWLKRLDGYVDWMDQAIANMREGIEGGVVQPRIVIEQTLPQLQAQLDGPVEDSPFFAPLRKLPDSISHPDQETLKAQYRMAIENELRPAYRRLHAFLKDEYLPACRDSVGWSALPDGAAWYDERVHAHTTTDRSAAEIHELGLEQVAALRAQMQAIMKEVGFEGELAEFFEHLRSDPRFRFPDEAAVLAAYRDLRANVEANVPKLFERRPRADFEIRPVEAFRAATEAAGSYMGPSPDGKRAGIFYVNTSALERQPRYATEALFLHEAIPGHHFQVALQYEAEELPRYRRLLTSYTAFGEGWALYAETLGPELGLYTDPYQRFGFLDSRIFRAVRLVVDTGLHAKGWSRQQAIDYLAANSSLAESDIVSEVDRYIAWPGQALGYMIGALSIEQMRATAASELGTGFDLRSWHSVVVGSGDLPMSVLESRNQRWIESQRAAGGD